MTTTIEPGDRFGRLTVIRRESHGRWRCACDCGVTCFREAYPLRAGTVRSCGCLLRETRANWAARRREAFITTLRAEGWTVTPPKRWDR